MAIASIVAALASLLASAAPGEPGARAVAYPIEPVPLRELVEKADVIVTARVGSKQRVELLESSLFASAELVVLKIDDALKGDPGSTMIQLVVDSATLCPSPARYEAGKRVLAFLQREPAGASEWAPDGLATCARSYGAKNLDDAGLEVYVARVKEQLAIQKMAEGAERRATQLEWLVRCAEEPASCWEGAYDLVPEGDPDAIYFDEPESPFAGALTLVHRERLYEGFLRADPGDRGARCLQHLLDADRDPRLLAWLVARLRATTEPEKDERAFEVRRVASQIAARDGRPEVAVVTHDLQELVFLPPEKRKPEFLVAERRRLVAELLALFPP